MPINWKDVLEELKLSVPEGTVTTYGELSAKFYQHPSAGTAIGGMLKAAAKDDEKNILYTNRVVGTEGQLIKYNGQREQLVQEGVPISDNKVDLVLCRLATLS
ncbi:MGMT family protein [Vibrio parahaemolyticus]|uniref:MGMT family protein n=1 Tax=Vibrio parahaemolyticus TaxID=670 RepID=UPI001021C592|nr:MGMT family protein [Vibrio parahaemolyticus]